MAPLQMVLVAAAVAFATAGIASAQTSPDGGSSVMQQIGQGAGTAAGNVAAGVESAGRGIADAGAAAYGKASSAASEAAQGASSGYRSAKDADAAAASAPTNDAEILGVVSAANKGEIEQAQLAKKQSRNAKVKSFASMMIKDHGAADQQAAALAKKKGLSPAESDASRRLADDAQSTVTRLQGMSGKDFDSAYVEAQVKAHEQVLASLDKALIPNAKDPQLKTMLHKISAKVASHLKQAQSLADALAR